MKISDNFITLDKIFEFYSVDNIKLIPGYWEEFQKLLKNDSSECMPGIRKLLDRFIKENVKLYSNNYYFLLEIRLTFYHQFRYLINHPKVFKSPIKALVSPNFITNFEIVTIDSLETIKTTDYNEEITEVTTINKYNRFITVDEIRPINRMLNILNNPSFKESKIIDIIKHRLDYWENYREPTRAANPFYPKYSDYSCHMNAITSYASLYLSKIGGILNEI